MKTFRTFLTLVMIVVSCFTVSTVILNPGLLAVEGVNSAMLLFTAAGGVATPFTFNLTYLPEILSFNDGGNPLTSLRVETQEDGVLHDWTTAGLAAMANFMKVGAITANDISLQLTDGELRPKNVTISGVTSAVGAVNFYGWSDNTGTAAFKSSNAQILALNPTLFEKFTAVFIPTMATLTDYAELTFDDGHNQRFEMEDFLRLSSNYQEVEGVIINNLAGNIKKAVVRCAAATPSYILSVFIPGQKDV